MRWIVQNCWFYICHWRCHNSYISFIRCVWASSEVMYGRMPGEHGFVTRRDWKFLCSPLCIYRLLSCSLWSGSSLSEVNRSGKKVKCTLVQALRPFTCHTANRGSRGMTLPFHDHGTRRGEESASRPGRSLPRDKPGTHLTGGWVGPRADLNRCGKSRPPPGFDSRTVQPVASRYTDWATRPTFLK